VHHARGEQQIFVVGRVTHAAPDVDRVWEAIAMHSIVGIADRRGLLTYLTYKGVAIDARRITDLDGERLRQVYAVYPRPAGDTSIRDAIVEHAARSEAAAPPTRSPPNCCASERPRPRPNLRESGG